MMAVVLDEFSEFEGWEMIYHMIMKKLSDNESLHTDYELKWKYVLEAMWNVEAMFEEASRWWYFHPLIVVVQMWIQ